MINIYDYYNLQYHIVRIYLKDGTTTTGELLSIDPFDDNEVEDALVLDVDGDPSIGRAVYASDIVRVEKIK